MTDPTPVPATLPIEGADPKPWFGSTTIWASAAGIGIGAILLLIPALLPLPGELSALLMSAGTGQIAAGVAAIRGRAAAEQPISPVGGILGALFGLRPRA